MKSKYVWLLSALLNGALLYSPTWAATRIGTLQFTGTGESMELPLGFLSDDGVTCVQFDVEFDAVSVPLGIPTTGDAAAGHRLDSTLAAAGRRRVVVYSTTLAALDGGVIVRFPAPGSLSGADLPMVTNIKLVTATGTTASLTTTDLKPVIAPTLSNGVGAIGQPRTLLAVAQGLGPFTYQWYFNGQAIAGATSATYVIASFSAANAGAYSLVVTNPAGSVATTPITLDSVAEYSRLVNLSVRGVAGTGEQTLIVGFVINGEGVKQVLLRGIGPGLEPFGVKGTASDPQIMLFRGGTLSNQNDNWGGGSDLATAFASVGAFGLPTGSKDAAQLVTLETNPYTAHLTTAAGAGVSLVEVYDADNGVSSAMLVNLSARNQVGTGENILIAGFVIAGNAPKKLLIRAVGPSLAQFEVGGVLANPKLQIFSGTNQIAENDDWGGGTELSTVFTSAGAFALPIDSRDSALLATLPPGAYTAQVSGVGATTGVALIEVYDVP